MTFRATSGHRSESPRPLLAGPSIAAAGSGAERSAGSRVGRRPIAKRRAAPLMRSAGPGDWAAEGPREDRVYAVVSKADFVGTLPRRIDEGCDHVPVDWHTLLDGVIGGVFGGIIGGGAALLATHQANKAQAKAAKEERLEQRRDRSRAAASLLLPRLADLESALPILPMVARDSYVMSASPASGRAMARLPSGAEAMESIKRGLMTEVPVVDNGLITRHYGHLTSVVGYFHHANLNAIEAGQAEGDIGRYLRYMRMLVVALIADKPLPADVEPPVIALGHAVGTDWEPDPKPDGWQ